MGRHYHGPALVLAAMSVFTGAAAHAQATGEWRTPEHAYGSACVYCHETGVAPVLKGRQLPVEYVRDRVRRGYNAMPAFKPSELGERDLEALAAWINASAAPPAQGR